MYRCINEMNHTTLPYKPQSQQGLSQASLSNCNCYDVVGVFIGESMKIYSLSPNKIYTKSGLLTVEAPFSIMW